MKIVMRTQETISKEVVIKVGDYIHSFMLMSTCEVIKVTQNSVIIQEIPEYAGGRVIRSYTLYEKDLQNCIHIPL